SGPPLSSSAASELLRADCTLNDITMSASSGTNLASSPNDADAPSRKYPAAPTAPITNTATAKTSVVETGAGRGPRATDIGFDAPGLAKAGSCAAPGIGGDRYASSVAGGGAKPPCGTGGGPYPP